MYDDVERCTLNARTHTYKRTSGSMKNNNKTYVWNWLVRLLLLWCVRVRIDELYWFSQSQRDNKNNENKKTLNYNPFRFIPFHFQECNDSMQSNIVSEIDILVSQHQYFNSDLMAINSGVVVSEKSFRSFKWQKTFKNWSPIRRMDVYECDIAEQTNK